MTHMRELTDRELDAVCGGHRRSISVEANVIVQVNANKTRQSIRFSAFAENENSTDQSLCSIMSQPHFTLAASTSRAFAHAQTPAQRGAVPGVLSGSDIGFRIERQGRDAVGGTLVVRINGEWVPAEPATRK